jgi:ABC-type transport system involved in multi-copper enzyme maturation permease subunit
MTLAIAGIRKFRTRTATIVSLIIAALLVALEFVLIGVSYRSATSEPSVNPAALLWYLTFPGAFDAILELTFLLLGITGLIYVASVTGSEWSWGTLKVAVMRGHSRWQYTVSTFASLAFILLIGLVITFMVGIVATFIGASLAGVSAGNPLDPGQLPQLALKLVRCWIALAGLTSLAYAVTMVARSQMAGIGTVIGYFIVSLIGPALLPDFVKEIFKYLPFSVAADAIGLQGPPTSGATSTSGVEPNLALLVIVCWLVGCLAVACVSVERAEISG